MTVPESPVEGLGATLRNLSPAFWMINLLELFERGAFYGLAAVLAAYLSGTLEFTDSQVGLVFALLFPLLYFVPLVAAAVAEKYGFKASLLVAWSVLLSGYAVLPFVTGFVQVVAAVVLVGVGAGAFKPIAAALVAQSTTDAQRNVAFTIYYGGINLGAFLFPLGIGLIGMYAPHRLNAAAFAVAVALTGVNLVLTALFFRNLRPPQHAVSVGAAVGRLGAILKDGPFLMLLLIFSGFWFMFAMNATFLPLYMQDYGVMPSWFNVALLATINPLVIILGSALTLVPPVSRALETAPSLVLMIAGMTLYVVGFVVLGFTHLPAFFVGAIVLYSVGELLSQPAYLSYVSKIAPPDRVAVYLGYGFIPIGVGLTLGSAFGGVLYERFSTELGQPTLFWALMSSVGLVTIAALIAYNRFMTTRAAGSARSPSRPGIARFVTGPAGAALALVLVPAVVGAGAFAGTTPHASDGGLGGVAGGASFTARGETTEGDAEDVPVTFHEDAAGTAAVTLEWTDEAADAGTTNTPDTFRVEVTLPNGSTATSRDVANGPDRHGRITLEVPARSGDHTIRVVAVESGDRVVQVGPVAVPDASEPDDGNAWTLTVTYGTTG